MDRRKELMFTAAVAAVSLMFLLSPGPAGPASTGEEWEEAAVKAWRERIRSVGPAEAYRELVELLEKKRVESPGFSVFMQHAAAHPFGRALYREEGLAGIGVCDDRFSYGCLHSFFGDAVGENSLGIVRKLNEWCIEREDGWARGCQHGIGHSILSYVGYSPRALAKALELCRDLPNIGVLGGCYGGVFMEYNLRSLWLTESSTRPLGDGGWGGPCANVPAYARLSCFSRLPQWWWELPELETEDAFTLLASRCREVASSEDERAACAWGVGRQVGGSLVALPSTVGDFDALFRFCSAAYGFSPEFGWCAGGLLKRIAEEGDASVAPAFCAEIPVTFRGPCLAAASDDRDVWRAFEYESFVR